MTSSNGFSRRQVFKTSAAIGGAIAAAPLLSACGSGKAATKASGVAPKSAVQAVLPTYKPSSAVTADIPSVTGANGAASDPAFLSYPASPPKSVTGAVGNGGSYSAVSPIWGSVPAPGNSYYTAVNQALGATLTDSPSDGTTFATMLATRFASGNIPDWLDVPGWNVSSIQNFAEGVDKFFKDLTPYLGGDKVLDYPNLAAIPTGGWQAAVWNGKLYGIPLWTSAASIPGAMFYRADIFKAAGIDAASVTTADTLKAVGKQVTVPAKGQYAFEDLSSFLYQLFNVPANNGRTGWKRDSTGKLVNGYEVPEFLEMLNFANGLAKGGLIHPDALAGDSSKAKNRFWAGKTVITADGTGAWNKGDAQSGVAANPSYERQAFKIFAYDGGKATMPLYPGAGMFSYLNKKLSDAQVKELLRIANYLAAPFGSAEYLVSRYGKEGVDYTMTSGAPILTDQGNKDVTDTLDQLANCQSVTFNAGYNQITKDYAAWQGDMVQHAYKPLFYAMNISEPAQTAKASTALEAVITDVRMGRKSVADFQSALSTWQNAGGNQLRDFYDGIAKQYGTGN
ncbi:extracellular solute-binding protein family 1 [Catenulispora acidiphila DSM 44928]|uniref:Extracellular solute-binding protein family 1 n=1 Tax=Catenulispora acidiphila (strain DSM 44928 / JCM 14897 / NBRC 102108 / NRRL B-24433 / ID139908) TaxID=479433 RepID=C7PZM8_CATAD|nr:ABC transporter substrate-binding protein [Catenulispora acidiphila]ACU73543.1 extracellular solute-binding protein family 1 [Catenulispora acidiphila DSM 44928]